MTDTSREAVGGLIADLLKPSGVDMQVAIEQATDALAALLDERDAHFKALMESNDESIDRRRSLDVARQRIRDLEAELAACKRAKAESDRRFQIEAAVRRERVERAEAERDKLAATVQRVRDKVAGWEGYAYLTRDVLAILTDTPEGSER